MLADVTMFDDQQVELLPARTTMTTWNRRKNKSVKFVNNGIIVVGDQNAVALADRGSTAIAVGGGNTIDVDLSN